MNKNFRNRVKSLSVGSVIALVISMFAPFLVTTASASTPTRVIVHLDRIKTGVNSSGWVCFWGSSATAITTLAVTFPTGFTFGTMASFASTNTANVAWPASAVGVTSVTATPANASQKITWTVTDTPSTSVYHCLNWAAGVINNSSGPSQSGSMETSADTTPRAWSIAIIADDQVVINNTTVPPLFTLTLGGLTDGFPSNVLSSSSTRYDSTGNTVQVNTNAANGWTVWAKDLNSGAGSKGALNSVLAGNYKLAGATGCALGSAAHTYNAAGCGVSTPEDYGLSSTITAGLGTANAAYINGGSNNFGVLDPSNFRAIAGDTVASSATNTSILVKVHAGISNQTPAATDYNDTITLVGAGLF